MIHWEWLFYFFRRKPKELAADLRPRSGPIGAPFGIPPLIPLDDFDRAILTTIEEVEVKLQTIRVNFHRELFNKAFKVLVEKVLTEPFDPNLYLHSNELGLSSQAFSFFWLEFKKLCDRKGIVCFNTEGGLGRTSFQQYMNKCQRSSTKTTTITEGPFR